MNIHPNADLDATISPSARAVLSRAPLAPSEQAGQMIGRYKLLQPIGEGGFGSVWMAEQREPVKRRVALKIIKLGMDTKQVIARFEAERQALAMMDHPNIAKVLDAGATETGRPYFVMEYIKGVPILEYCDTDKLDTKARLALFGNVCHAIQHAHQKGIIHRDIKPSNVLITMHDGVPVPKVIDFGIAKATCAELTTKTLFTEHRQMIGTPAYMSPEQAEMSGLDIDTRSDIYSLGVLLYELLTGTTPFAHEELMSKGFAEMMRIIREVEPHKPSTRLSSLGDTGTRTALQRHAGDVKKLGLILRGDLDWIVMKCLEKDRTRRYETANGLAADIKRHLSDQPVTAAAPSAGYKLRKFVKRNRAQVTAASVVAGALVLGVVGTTRGMVWALNEKTRADVEKNNATLAAASEAKAKIEAQDNEKRAVAEAKKAEGVTKFLQSMFAAADPHTKQRPGLTMREMLDEVAPTVATKLADQPEVQAKIHSTIGLAYQHLGKYGDSESHLKRAQELWSAATGDDAPDGLADATFRFGWLYHDRGEYLQAEQIVREALALTIKAHGADSVEAYGVLAYLGDLRRHLADFDGAEKILREVIAKTESRGKEGAGHMRFALRNLSLVLTESGRAREGEETQRRLDAMPGESDAKNISEKLTSLSVLQMSLESQGKRAEAIAVSDQAVDLVRQQAAEECNDSYWLSRLFGYLDDRGRLALESDDPDTAERLYAEKIEASRKLITLQPTNPNWHGMQAAAFRDWGNLSKPPHNRADTGRYFKDALDAARAGLRIFPSDSNLYRHVESDLAGLAEVALNSREPAQAEKWYIEQIEANGVLRTLDPAEPFWIRNQSRIAERMARMALARWDRATAAALFKKSVEYAKEGIAAFPKDGPLAGHLNYSQSWVDWLAKLPALPVVDGGAAHAGADGNPYRVSFVCTRVTDERTVETVEGFQLRPQGTWWLHKIDDKENEAHVRAAFESLVLGGAGKRVEIEFDGYLAYKDRAGIIYANLYVNGVCINEKMLREGYYDLYDRIDYQSKEKYRALRDDAKAAGRGIWATASAPIESKPDERR